MANLIFRELERVLQHVLYVDGFEAALVRARERLEIADDRADPLGAMARLADPADDLVQTLPIDSGARKLTLEIAQAQDDVGERVVDLVRNARRQRAERGETVGLDQPCLDGLTLGDVASERQDG
jgi:hypothetical protein